MNENYTVLAFIRDEPLRILSMIRNFEGRAKIIALVDREDTLLLFMSPNMSILAEGVKSSDMGSAIKPFCTAFPRSNNVSVPKGSSVPDMMSEKEPDRILGHDMDMPFDPDLPRRFIIRLF